MLLTTVLEAAPGWLALALRNLLHDRVRFAVTLTGIVFAVVLSAVQLGLFVGFTRATSDVITHAGADLWVLSRGVTHLESGVPFAERKVQQVRAVPGVAAAATHIVAFGNWMRPDGGLESILVIGFDLAQPLGAPWNLVEGSLADLARPDAVVIDELYRDKLGVTRVGQVVEIRGTRARVVGFTRGIRTFTTAPPVFTSVKNAQRFLGLPEDRTLYLLVRARPDVAPAALAARLAAAVSDVEVLPADAWSARQRRYWMFGTGAGISVLVAAGLGLLVGVVVVAQTIYAATVDHIREFGTLKAMGATNGFLYRVIVQQAATGAVIGYAIGMTIAAGVSRASLEGTTAIVVPWPLAAALGLLTLVMCVTASIVSIHKVTHLDPAMVFRG